MGDHTESCSMTRKVEEGHKHFGLHLHPELILTAGVGTPPTHFTCDTAANWVKLAKKDLRTWNKVVVVEVVQGEQEACQEGVG